MVNWRKLNEEGKDRCIEAWADQVKSYMLGAAALTRQKGQESVYHTVDELCENCEFPRSRWPDVKDRMIARGMQISYEHFRGYWWGGEDDVRSILQHPMYIVTGILKSARRTSIAMAQGGHDPADVSQWIANTGVRPDVFCKTLASWEGVEPLPLQFERLLLGSGT
jgi:hypothetical protein